MKDLFKKRAFLNHPLWPPALFLFFLILLFFVKANILNAPYHWDVMGYVMPSAENFFQTGRLGSLTGLSGHPPLFFILLAFCWKVFGQSVFVSHGLVLFFGAFGLTFAFILTEKIFSWKEAAAAVCLLFFNPLFFAQVGLVYLSVPLAGLAVSTVFFYLRRRHILYLISAAAMILIKETAAVVVASIVVYDLLLVLAGKVKWREGLRRAAVLSLPFISLAFWILYHWKKSGWIFNTKLLVNRERALTLFRGNFFRHLIFDASAENVNRYGWIIFLALTVYLVCQAVKGKRLKAEWLFLMIVILNILFFSYTDDLPRYFLIFYPFYFILGARAFVGLSAKLRLKDFVSGALVMAVILLSVTHYSGRRDTDGWRLESNMEYLDFVRICQSAARFIESGYPEFQIITTFPLTPAFQIPRYGYVSRPLSVVPVEMFENYEDVLVVRSLQANYLDFNRFLQSQKDSLKRIAEFARKGKRVVVYKKGRAAGGELVKREESSEPD